MNVEVAAPGQAKTDGPLKLAVPRGALFAETLDLLDAAGHRDRRGAQRVAGADLPRREADPGDDAPLRRADLRRGRRRRRRHNRQGRPARAVRPDGLRAARPRLRTLPHGPRRAPGRREPRRVAATPRDDADRDQVPADRRTPLRGERPSDRGDRGQGLGRAGAADRPRRRHRRPGRHRPHPGGERPRGARGDRRVHGPLRRQPRRPQAAGGRGRRADRAVEGGGGADEGRAVRVGGGARRARSGCAAGPRSSREPVDVGEIFQRGGRQGRRGRARPDQPASTRPSEAATRLRVDPAEATAALARARARACGAALEPPPRTSARWPRRRTRSSAESSFPRDRSSSCARSRWPPPGSMRRVGAPPIRRAS